VTIADLTWGAACPVQPLRKIHQFDFVVDAYFRDRHLDDVESLSDPGDPFVTSDRSETLGHGFIQGGRRNLDGMRDAVHVPDRDAA